MADVTKCQECGEKVSAVEKRQLCRAVIFTRDRGSLECLTYQKDCAVCTAVYCPSFAKITQKDGTAHRNFETKNFLGVTLETYFETKFLDQVTEDLVTLDSSTPREQKCLSGRECLGPDNHPG